MSYSEYEFFGLDSSEGFSEEEREAYFADYDDSMDGDFDSAMESAGHGTDEDYGYYENDGDF